MELMALPSNLVPPWQRLSGSVPNAVELLYLKVIVAFHNRLVFSVSAQAGTLDGQAHCCLGPLRPHCTWQQEET